MRCNKEQFRRCSRIDFLEFLLKIIFLVTGHRSPSGSRNKVFLLCLLYAWGVPAFITGLTLIIDHTEAMNVAYGRRFF